MTEKRTTLPHDHYPLYVAGVFRATCTAHFWVPIAQPATPAKAAS